MMEGLHCTYQRYSVVGARVVGGGQLSCHAISGASPRSKVKAKYGKKEIWRGQRVRYIRGSKFNITIVVT